MEFEKRSDGRMACPFDHHSLEYQQRYGEIFDELREKAPIAWTDNHGGYWVVTNHELARKLDLDSERLQINQKKGEMEGGLLIPVSPGNQHRLPFVPGEADGEEHDKYRLALNPHFSKQRVAELQPLIDRYVAKTIDDILAQGEFDVIEELAGPILSGIACEILGLEVERPRPFFITLFALVSFGAGVEGELSDVRREFQESWATIVKTVAERRANPRNDVISALTQWTTPAFTDEEIQQMTLNVILGAADTTGTLISKAILYMYEHPEVKAQLSANPELVTPAIDEFLRLVGIAMGVGRTAMADIEVNGVTIKKGDRVLLSYYGANHDPRKYPNPNVFDLERGAPQHLGMGLGEHFCLGAWLAKAISATTIREFLRRVPDYRIDVDRARKGEDISTLNHWLTMPAYTH
jgi:cytochrome P450